MKLDKEKFVIEPKFNVEFWDRGLGMGLESLNGLMELSMMEDGSRPHLRNIHHRGLTGEEKRVDGWNNSKWILNFNFTIYKSLFIYSNNEMEI